VLGRTAVGRLVRRLIIGSMLRFPLSRRLAAERLSGIGITYPRASRDDDKLVGQRMPDVACGDTRVYEVLRNGRFLLATGPHSDSQVGHWPGVDHVVHSDPSLPAAVLIRPDGYIAWATRKPPVARELSAALTRWCGPQTEAGVPNAVS
jgi:hypothetical protein